MLIRSTSLWSRVVAVALIGPLMLAPVQVVVSNRAMAQEAPDEPAEQTDVAPAATTTPVDIQPAQLEELVEDVPEQLAGPGVEYTAPSTTGAGDKNAAKPQAISLPSAEGSIQGMGESFSPMLSVGIASYAVPFGLPPGRAGVAPQLGLSYSSAGGGSSVGLGWSLGTSFIARGTDRGLPRYIDAAAWHALEDRFFFNGGQELIPVSTTAAMLVDCDSSTCAPIPDDLTGWQQYRARVEGAYQRFFRSPDSRRWVVQSVDGTRYDFGALPTGGPPELMATGAAAALQSELPLGLGRVYRWLLTRVTDPHGSTTYLVYSEDQGERHLEDVYYTSPHEDCGELDSAAARMECDASLADYGRRVHFVYEPRPDHLTSYLSGWAITLAQRLRRVEISAAEGAPGTRTHVRRYHLTYEASSFHSLLASVQIEGRLATTDTETGVVTGDANTPEGSLGDDIDGQTLPPLRFSYTAQPSCGDEAPGFGGVDCATVAAPFSPDRSVDDARADLFDVNSDGLPDLIVTDPAHYRTDDDGPGVGVYFNGFDGPAAEPAEQAGTFSDPIVTPVPPELASTLSLSNANVVPMDIDSDGRSDLLHMPRLANYGYFTPARDLAPSSVGSVSPLDQGWRWSYVERAVPSGTTDPRIDLGGDGVHIRTLDVNHDHLIDVVRTTGTTMQTWLNLGYYPDGDGRFGSAIYEAETWTLSTDPIERCLPHAGLPIDFADPEVQLGDLNGDGLQDIVRLHAGSMVYWPGRGDGTWGEGPTDCPPGFADGREIAIANPPAELNPELDAVYLGDVNSDGLDDVVQVRTTAIDVWFNKAGLEFTDRVVTTGTPFAPAFANRVRLVDIDGSATVDVLYADSGDWRWVDLMAGRRPRLLETVFGSLGSRTTFAYGTSAEDYLADLREAAACVASDCERFTWESLPGDCDTKVEAGSGECVFRTGGSPVVSTVVRNTTTEVGLGDPPIVNTYAYHDGYYDGAEHEFRGFGGATEAAIGDANQGTMFTRTFYHQGRRASAHASDLLHDNPDEPLKGQAYRTEIWSEDGDYLSSTHRTMTLRELHAGLDGRMVRTAFERQSDELVYDVANFEALNGALTLPHVERPGGIEETDVLVRGTIYAHMRNTADDVDNLGHALQATAHGRIAGETPGEDLPDETIESHTEYINVPDSLTGWLWRQSLTWVEGHGSTTELGKTLVDYDSAGDAISATTYVDQATTYSFSPTLGSPNPEDLLSTTIYDVWGNSTATCVGGEAATGEDCLRYGSVTYDSDYATFPVSESEAARRNGSGWDMLTTTAEWDRGLGSISSVTDPNDDVSSLIYDGCGRPTSLTPPPVVGCDEGTPIRRIVYELATPGGVPISRVTNTSVLSCDGEDTSAVIVYFDGLGRERATITTGDGTSGREWIRAGYVAFDARGSVARAHDPEFYSGSTTDLLAATAEPDSLSVSKVYDAFGRETLTIERDGYITLSIVYHALSHDTWDWHHMQGGGDHFGMYETERVDGHGRVVDHVLRNKHFGSSTVEYYRLMSEYRADGGLTTVTRARTDSDEPDGLADVLESVSRSFTYDTAGRRIATSDPDTNDPNPSGGRWRYLFNRAGDLVAMRDPRGCGQDFYYDHGGRPLGEKYIGCTEAMTKYSPSETIPAGAVLWTETTESDSVHVRMVYDAYDDCWEPDPTGLDDYPTGDAGGMLGRVACSADRAQRTLFGYDHRGQLIWQGRQVLVLSEVGGVAATLSNPPPDMPAKATLWPPTQTVLYDEIHTWVATHTYDHAGRARALALPPALGYYQGTYVTPRRVGRIAFGPRGLPSASTIDLVSNATGFTVTDGEISWSGATIDTHPVTTSLIYDATGNLADVTYGDTGGSREPTESHYTYDDRSRLEHSWTEREPTGSGMDRPLAAVAIPFDQTLAWDPVDNLVSITDNRGANEWPAGYRPQNVTLGYDDLYRVAAAAYTYNQDTGSPTEQDDATDWRDDYDQIRASDRLRPLTPAMAPALPDDRVVSLQWDHDWLGNMTYWGDDAHAFYERSIGTITNGAVLGVRPSALYLAADLGGTSSDRGGYVEVTYGISGNAATMTVHAQCVDTGSETCDDPGGTNLGERREDLHDHCECAVEQHYQYIWDEADRLIEARRYDRAGTGDWAIKVQHHFAYDSDNQRIVTMTYDRNEAWPIVKWNVEVFPGDLELHDANAVSFGSATYWPNEVFGTETHHLLAGARVVWNNATPVSGLDDGHRITVPLTDIIDTTAAVIDLRSGELLETSTYYPNGARETFRTHPSYAILPERHGFTGKEANEDIGIVYFGQRWYAPRLARWLSPDPLAIHALGGGEAMNSYHYISGSLLQAQDPIGLQVGSWAPVDRALIKVGKAWWRFKAKAADIRIDRVKGGTDPSTYIDTYDAVEKRVERVAPLLCPTYGACGPVPDDLSIDDFVLDTGYESIVVNGQHLYDGVDIGLEGDFDTAADELAYVAVDAEEAAICLLEGGSSRPTVRTTPKVRPKPRPIRTRRLPQDIKVGPKPPKAKTLTRKIGLSKTQNAELQREIRRIKLEGAKDIRVNQEQVNARGVRVGRNRPDLQYTRADGKRVYVEYETRKSNRGPGHKERLEANDPEGEVDIKVVD